ncbi:MAG: extracellular solute-binding protein [Treponema sp.]|nr:extracellular solute-binding protein [Treponema sp.]
MNKTLRITIIVVAVVAVLAAVFALRGNENFHEKYEGFDLSASSSAVVRENTYREYLKSRAARYPSKAVAVDIFNFDADDTGSAGVRVESGYHGADRALMTEDGSSVTWTVDVPEEGFYNIELTYIATPSRNVNMERVIKINGEVPFTGADIVTFRRLWKDDGEIRTDNQGRQIRPHQSETFDWQTVRCKSDSGYETEPYQFYFKQGKNTVTFDATNEPMVFKAISLAPVEKLSDYATYIASHKGKKVTDTSSIEPIILEGEKACLRSDPSLFGLYDRSSPVTQPYSVSKTVFNYIGGISWKTPGQWIEWEFDAPEDGYYQISIQGRQFHQRGYVSCRSLMIDGVIPFDAVQSVEFDFSSDWKLTTPTNPETKEPYQFYMSKGKHKIRLEATLGKMGDLITELEDSVYRLNSIYRTILVLTGAQPDQFRDYEIHKVYPNEVEAMNIESKRLYRLVDRFGEITGQKSDLIAPAQTLAVQLERFYKNPNKITEDFVSFKSNITSLGSSLLTLTEGKLDIDFIEVTGTGTKPKAPKSNFALKAKHEIVSFVTSFFVDSTQLGDVFDKDDEHLIEIWLTTGRDQSEILKTMVDDSFGPATGIHANVKLINADALLNAVVAGNGPDVVLTIANNLPVDYALRNANVNLMKFPDCKEVLSQFNPSAYEGYKYDGGVYALPEQESFNLLFYRKDILAQLEIDVPQTWDDLIAILPTLQGNNLEVGIPFPSIQAPDMTGFYSLVFQNGGRIYNDAGTKTELDDESGIAAFKTYTSLYNSYGLPTYFDFTSRFRSGEMPIGIANYGMYNNLAVAAPEIRGLWDFTYLPGTEKVDANGNVYIDRSTGVGGNCCMMISKGSTDFVTTEALNTFLGDTSAADKEQMLKDRNKKVLRNIQRQADSWEFMKWWVSTETQVRFGREIEALLGASSRYATANVEALKQLPWSTKELNILLGSLEETVGVPEVPGSYYTSRHVINGIRKVINTKDDPRETLIDYARKINDELTRKRQEFNLPVEEE